MSSMVDGRLRLFQYVNLLYLPHLIYLANTYSGKGGRKRENERGRRVKQESGMVKGVEREREREGQGILEKQKKAILSGVVW